MKDNPLPEVLAAAPWVRETITRFADNPPAGMAEYWELHNALCMAFSDVRSTVLQSGRFRVYLGPTTKVFGRAASHEEALHTAALVAMGRLPTEDANESEA